MDNKGLTTEYDVDAIVDNVVNAVAAGKYHMGRKWCLSPKGKKMVPGTKTE